MKTAAIFFFALLAVAACDEVSVSKNVIEYKAVHVNFYLTRDGARIFFDVAKVPSVLYTTKTGFKYENVITGANGEVTLSRRGAQELSDLVVRMFDKIQTAYYGNELVNWRYDYLDLSRLELHFNATEDLGVEFTLGYRSSSLSTPAGLSILITYDSIKVTDVDGRSYVIEYSPLTWPMARAVDALAEVAQYWGDRT